MGNGDYGCCIFPLTSFQIRDLQSYLSYLSLFLASESGKLYILVDNRPWLKDLVLRPTHLWQLMVTKSRLSPFANSRGRKERNMSGELLDSSSSSTSNTTTTKSKSFKKWFSLIDAASLSKKRAMLPVKKLRSSLIANSKLHGTLYGFIVFEVSWGDVRGINYSNELQTDTSLAIEAKLMRRWEFDSIAQASRCISSWFPGTLSEQILLKEFLVAAIGEVFYDAQDGFPGKNKTDIDENDRVDMCTGDESSCCPSSSFRVYSAATGNRINILCTPPPDGPYKRRKVMKSVHCVAEFDICSEEADAETFPLLSQTSDARDYQDTLGGTLHRDVLILFRFNDHDLPFKLKEIIMTDLRLLTLLESGLPSWVIFLQSYPVFCHLYRPWMCPLARALYVLISIVTVLIGFYDLYKNVPLLKATASRLFGPLFDWIETWEMVSRIKYLGTMLFLHNSQKAIKWFLMVSRTMRSFLSILAQPLTGAFAEFLDFFLPLWSMCMQLAEFSFSTICMVVVSCFTLIGDLIEMLLLPFWYVLVVMWNIAAFFIYPVFWVMWEILYAPFRLVFGLCSVVAFLCESIYDVIGDMWLFTSGIFQFTRDVESTVSSHEVSLWCSIWNDLFSQVFRALRSILNGFAAFFTACNRHRLSIYNHAKEFVERLSCTDKRKLPEETSQTTSGGWKVLHHRMKFRQD